MIRYLKVAAYVGEEFDRSLFTEFWTPAKREKSLQRVYKLAALALNGFEIGRAQWTVNHGQYRSIICDEPIVFDRMGDLFFVYRKTLEGVSTDAIFKSDHMAAMYFVWLVSGGERAIDWSLFLDMEP